MVAILIIFHLANALPRYQLRGRKELVNERTLRKRFVFTLSICTFLPICLSATLTHVCERTHQSCQWYIRISINQKTIVQRRLISFPFSSWFSCHFSILIGNHFFPFSNTKIDNVKSSTFFLMLLLHYAFLKVHISNIWGAEDLIPFAIVQCPFHINQIVGYITHFF